MEYLSFWLIYLLIWCNLCKRQQFKDSTLQNDTDWNKLYCFSSFNNNNKKDYKRFFSNYDSTFVLLGEREELENFLNFNKRSGRGRGRGSRFWKNVKNSVQLTRTQSKFDAYRLFCHNKFTRRKVNTKFAFEKEIFCL